MIRKLARCVGEFKKQAILTPLFMVFEVMLECLIPFIIAQLVNRIKAGCDFSEIATYGLILFGMACLSLTFGALGGATAATASAGFARNLRRRMYYRIQDYSFENIDRFSSSSLVTRMTTDIQYVQMSFMMIIRIAVRAPLMFLFAITMAFIMGGSLALMFVVVVPILLCGLLLIARKAMPMFRRIFKKYDKLNESIEENIKGMRVVKSFVREGYEKDKFGAVSDEVCADFTRAERVVAFNSPLMQFCLYFNMIFVMLVGSRLIISSGGVLLDVGQYSAILTYGFQILSSLMTLSMIYVTLTISAESAKRIVEVLEEESTITSPENAVKEVKDGSITFSRVSFKYSRRAERDALSGINLSIASGQVVGIIGGTGSSKSTLVQLIPRLYDVTDGTVSVGGVDVRDYDLDALRNAVAMVLQKNELFSGTFAENLRWGNESATDEELREACHLACADEFVERFPDGYNTKIEQGGTNVSGGQKQRLCIARALLKKPKILILDDSTSAVDTKTDAIIRKGFREFIPETTKIIIAQRISSVQDADVIVVMDGGRIDGIGTHEELLANNAIYGEVYRSQNGVPAGTEA
ncbi:MAG: ABC transporter ATP-binding protein [Clostridia bacterium]|nr:ABC transporter ATP-binding protein [Clostridia bacterium]